MEVDSEGRMGNVFWSDARSRRAYGFFGDVVVFDTTFNKNRYRMVFAPLLGVNNHRQTVLFGCAFLTSETTDSFVWLLEEFKKAMPGEPPKMIITDQYAAMSKTIVVTLSTTFHRYCIWHVLNKITEKPGIGECFSEMNKCIWDMDKKEEFDAKWEEIITNNGLQDHAWLSSIHAMRENWTQGVNADHVDYNENPPLPFQTPMQHQMRCIYTREILEMFEREDFRSLLCLLELVDEDETHCRYKVSERVNPGVTRIKELVHDKDADKAYCSYKGFEFWGIPCRHILAFLRMKQVEHLLDKYILKRWLQSEKSGVIYDKNHKEVNDCIDGLLLVKRSKVCKVARELIDSALLRDEGFELLEKSFEDIRGKLTTSSSFDTELGGPVGENLQPTQRMQDSEPTMTESFMQEFDFMYGPVV
ncbi:PREDICTED: protein FAR1-RELATED SEQUENCE 5-like [Prunus mume]|uniref:Protein FAR1-RELATED SEQUENCE n=1 Tax=Prunus mume TaxID=102107 RepID=A0ABM0PE89_PRUMU|nr:PREDICTED: protein FAR1-RELATED SEQUENCE 5-like [Prunus mume]